MSQYWRIKYEKEVKELLTISPKLKQKAENLLFKIAAKKNISLESRRNNLEQGTSHRIKRQLPVLVGIHVRRGDKAYKKWPLPGRNYFHRAMEYFRKKYKKVYFIVASTDKKWTEQNIFGKDVLYSTASSDILDLTLLSLCDHTIMSVGTFSWWAAYLAGGEVIYYRDHKPKEGRLARFYNDSQYFLPHWKPLV